MKYTEHYHLPQWVKEDRVMMEDFNQMCANVDAGLAGNDGRTRKGMEWLWRLAYNHFCTLQNTEPSPRQIGMFYQNPAKDAGGFTGLNVKDGFSFVGSGSVTPYIHNPDLYTEQLTSLKVVKGDLENSIPLTVQIDPPSAGVIRQFVLRGQFSNNTPNTPAPFRLTMNNQRTGEVEQSIDLDFADAGYSGVIINQFVRETLYFHGGDRYIMKLEPLAAVFDMEMNAIFSENTSADSLYNKQSLRGSHVMEEIEESSGGLLVLRCAMGGPTGKLTVEWDGRAIEPTAVRLLRHSDGRVIKEHLYFRDETIPAKTTFSLAFDCGTCGDFWLYDWGAILL